MLAEEDIAKHLSPVELRLYSSSNRQGKLAVITSSRRVCLVGEILAKLDDLGHPLGEVFSESNNASK
ncbi:MAG: hypothetical protein AUJ28_00230 [Parcubacteria group bacterium CG1_02_37_51]|nr:MAG: hypothetical protein AUJ28_00230 [Parcubacteria group bacterium CG1_02_37_51]